MNSRYNSTIGSHHGEMARLVRNPFRSKYMRGNFDAAVATYDSRHKDFIHLGYAAWEMHGQRISGAGSTAFNPTIQASRTAPLTLSTVPDKRLQKPSSRPTIAKSGAHCLNLREFHEP